MTIIKKARNKQWYFVVKARNGKTLVQSETYKQKASAVKAIASLKKSLL